MRLRALKEMGIKEVDISIVNADTEAKKIKYALSDNDRAGEYDEQQLAELVYPHIEEINLEEYKVDLGKAVDLKIMADGFGPSMDYSDLDGEMEDLGEGLDTVTILITIPKRYEEKTKEWLANGELRTAAGYGMGILKRCELL